MTHDLDTTRHWDTALPDIQVVMNSAPNKLTGHTPHCLIYGINIYQSWSLIKGIFWTNQQDFSACDDAWESVKYAAIVMKNGYDVKHLPLYLQPGDQAYLYL